MKKVDLLLIRLKNINLKKKFLNIVNAGLKLMKKLS